MQTESNIQKLLHHEISGYESSSQSYRGFQDAIITADGNEIVFTYLNGVRYFVQSQYLYQCYDFPQFRLQHGKWIALEDSNDPKRDPTRDNCPPDQCKVIRIKKLRYSEYELVPGYHEVIVYFNNGTANEVQPEHVLIDCEPIHQDFGGFMEETIDVTRARAHRWLESRNGKCAGELLESAITDENFGTFYRVSRKEDGRAVDFDFQCRELYSLHAELVATIGSLVKPSKVTCSEQVTTRSAIAPDKSSVRIWFQDKSMRVITPRDILRACDPRYDQFNGFPSL